MIKVFDSQVEHEDDDSEEEFIYQQGASLGHSATAKTMPGAYYHYMAHHVNHSLRIMSVLWLCGSEVGAPKWCWPGIRDRPPGNHRATKAEA